MNVLRNTVWAATAALAFGAGSSAQAATTLSSSAYGLSADLDILHLIGVSAGPFAPTSGTAPGAYSNSATVAQVNDTLNLGLGTFKQGLSTGVLTSTASSPYPAGRTATGQSVVNNLDTGLSALLGPSILSIGATTITSTSSVSDVLHPSAVGSSDIEGLTVTGLALGGITINGSAYAHAAPNTVLLNLAGLEIILNQQIPSGDGISSAGMQTNAIVVEFTNFVLGAGLLNGDIIVAHSQADIMGAPGDRHAGAVHLGSHAYRLRRGRRDGSRTLQASAFRHSLIVAQRHGARGLAAGANSRRYSPGCGAGTLRARRSTAAPGIHDRRELPRCKGAGRHRSWRHVVQAGSRAIARWPFGGRCCAHRVPARRGRSTTGLAFSSPESTVPMPA